MFTEKNVCRIILILLLLSESFPVLAQDMHFVSYFVKSSNDWQEITEDIHRKQVQSAKIHVQAGTTIEELSFDFPKLHHLEIVGTGEIKTINTRLFHFSNQTNIRINNIHFVVGSVNNSTFFINAEDYAGIFELVSAEISLQHQSIRLNGVEGAFEAKHSRITQTISNTSENSLLFQDLKGLLLSQTELEVQQVHLSGVADIRIQKSTIKIQNDFVVSQVNKADFSQNTINFISGGLNISAPPTLLNENRGRTTSSFSVVNNMISSSTSTAVIIEGLDNIYFVHNSIRGRIAFSAPLLFVGTIKNNIFYGSNGLAFDLEGFGTQLELDYNIYYSKSGILARVGESIWEHLIDWQLDLSQFNAHSHQGDPVFVSPMDLHIKGLLPNNKGDSTVNIPIDFDGDLRPLPLGSAVDIGADEYLPPIIDVVLSSIFIGSDNCQNASLALFGVVENFGTTIIPAGTVLEVQIFDGLTTQVISTTLGNHVHSGERDTIFIQSLLYQNGTILNILGNLFVNADNRPDNNAISRTLSLAPQRPLVIDSVSICSSATSVTLTALQPLNYPVLWFEEASDSIPFGIGNAVASTQSGIFAPIDSFYAGVASFPSSLKTPFSGSDTIDVSNLTISPKTNIFITDVSVVPIESGWSFVNVFVRKNPTESWQLLYMQNDLLQANHLRKFSFNTPYAVMLGESAEIRILINSGSRLRGLYFQDDTESIIENQDISIQPTLNTTSVGAGMKEGFFSGKIGYLIEPCPNFRSNVSVYSAEDTVYAAFTTIQQPDGSILFDASSSLGNRFVWDFGNGYFSMGQQVLHHYFNENEFLVTLTVYNDPCGLQDNTNLSVAGSLSDVYESNQDIQVFPNPSSDYIQILGNLRNSSDAIRVTIVNALGQKVQETAFYNDSPNRIIDISGLSNGLYYITLEDDLGELGVHKVVKN